MSVATALAPRRMLTACLFGAAPDTGNLGVSALCYSILSGLAETGFSLGMTIFDHGIGLRPMALGIADAFNRLDQCGAINTRRLHRPESLTNIRLCARFGGLWNSGATRLLAADAVLDISGGDSFTDLYGPHRFQSVVLPKRIAIECRKPLMLLPQTYGPFRSITDRRIAENIVRASAMAWARDARSYSALRELLGEAYDPSRHRLGVDVAFRLPVSEPTAPEFEVLRSWLADRSTPIVGVNVSGLLYNQQEKAAKQYGLKANYRRSIAPFVRRLLAESDARILLTPHVVALPGHYESDIGACQDVAGSLGEADVGRVAVCPAFEDPREVKWVIAQCDWFCGTRMHSAIAALSTGVPTAAISYSPKTLGVFETCGQGAEVADPQTLDSEEMVEFLWSAWRRRDESRRSLANELPHVIERAAEQMDAILAGIAAPAEAWA